MNIAPITVKTMIPPSNNKSCIESHHMRLSDAITASANSVEHFLDRELSESNLSSPYPAPSRLINAVRHGALNGGKRLRPLLVKLSAELIGDTKGDLVRAGAAVEYVHCYSLVHDDLPDMDDDDLRRGQPTVHVAFDPATAILAGDSLLTHAFGVLADARTHPDANIRTQLITELVQGAGVGGMAGGQMRDIEGERQGYDPETISLIHAMKTGAIIRASVRMGAIMAGASSTELLTLTTFAESAGRIYQLSDDILDATKSSAQLGKTAGKDAAQGKSTLIASHGLDHAHEVLNEELQGALALLEPFGERARLMNELVTHFAKREA
ncbi:polyprenyl synthetase family protein [Maritalea porphyrae]|uniref:polyprenyl synthetase family protein n=1 Tax=Maritalea porphyrae TaxID=880732 RepID=UPI0022B00A3C|nr:farnesyl diphosphate synthase [Maritalea porphyrae]MCZ4274207.1 polyprenyl synthetase family protein [Maritalea porphyrae]